MSFNEAVKDDIKKLEGKPFSSYCSLFVQFANYFIDTPPSKVDVDVIFTTDELINNLYSRSMRENWSIDIREVLRDDALTMSNMLVSILDKHPSVSPDQYKYYGSYVKQLGEILDSIGQNYCD